MGSFEVERGQRYREGGQRGRCTERGQRYAAFEGAELELDPVASVSKLEHVTRGVWRLFPNQPTRSEGRDSQSRLSKSQPRLTHLFTLCIGK